MSTSSRRAPVALTHGVEARPPPAAVTRHPADMLRLGLGMALLLLSAVPLWEVPWT
jgi:hypothetical protein